MAGHPARTRRIDTAAPQRRSTAAANVDFVTDRQTWLGVQNGIVHFAPAPRASAPRYLLDGRDLSDYLQKIRSGIAWQNAAAIIGAMDAAAAPELDIDDFHSLFGLARSISGSAMFYQKMLVQRRVRPDAVGGLITLRRDAAPLDASLWSSTALELVQARNGNTFLPQAHPYGTPPHPSYPAGLGTLAGTGATILKALVNERYTIAQLQIPTADGTQLVAYSGAALTIGGELDKLAAICAYRRGTSGVQYRSDSLAGL